MEADQCWLQWMKIGEKTGCHQKPDRSFFVKGYQMPVCARCTGVFLGYLLAIPGFFLFGFSKLFAFGGSLLLFADWMIQAIGMKESTNGRRLVTGIFGGYGMMLFQLYLIKGVIKYLVRNSNDK